MNLFLLLFMYYTDYTLYFWSYFYIIFYISLIFAFWAEAQLRALETGSQWRSVLGDLATAIRACHPGDTTRLT